MDDYEDPRVRRLRRPKVESVADQVAKVLGQGPRCSHMFHDSHSCIHCGWVPPATAGARAPVARVTAWSIAGWLRDIVEPHVTHVEHLPGQSTPASSTLVITCEDGEQFEVRVVAVRGPRV